jgi:hypothetical protein
MSSVLVALANYSLAKRESKEMDQACMSPLTTLFQTWNHPNLHLTFAVVELSGLKLRMSFLQFFVITFWDRFSQALLH